MSSLSLFRDISTNQIGVVLFGPVGMLFSPVHWLDLVATDLRRIVGLMWDTTPIPRPTEVEYLVTAAGPVALYPWDDRLGDPPRTLLYRADPGLGLDPDTGQPQLRLLSDERGVGAVLRRTTENDLARAAAGGKITIMLVDATEQNRWTGRSVPSVRAAFPPGRPGRVADHEAALIPA